MAERASAPRRSNRPAAGARGSAGWRASGLQPGQGERPRAGRGNRISWPRRIGFVIALCLVGGAVAVAGGFVGGSPGPATPRPRPSVALAGDGSRSAAPSFPSGVPLAAPVVAPPAQRSIPRAAWTIHVTIPDLGMPRQQVRLAVYRNGARIATVRLPAGSTMSANLKLQPGANRIVAAFVGPGGQGPHSAPVSLIVDARRPTITIRAPADGTVVATPSVTLRGVTEQGATVTITNVALGRTLTAIAARNGAFSVAVPLEMGSNALRIAAADAAGNTVRSALTVVRDAGRAQMQLTLSTAAFHLRRLPQSFEAQVTITDVSGNPLDGGTVTFSVSPPGQPTSTFQAPVAGGHATWSHATLPREGTIAGQGFVTARVSLRDGTALLASAPFTIR